MLLITFSFLEVIIKLCKLFGTHNDIFELAGNLQTFSDYAYFLLSVVIIIAYYPMSSIRIINYLVFPGSLFIYLFFYSQIFSPFVYGLSLFCPLLFILLFPLFVN